MGHTGPMRSLACGEGEEGMLLCISSVSLPWQLPAEASGTVFLVPGCPVPSLPPHGNLERGTKWSGSPWSERVSGKAWGCAYLSQLTGKQELVGQDDRAKGEREKKEN